MAQFLILGTSAGWASAQRASSSYLLDLGEQGVLFDIGDGATRNFLAAQHAPEWVTDIFISHTDSDHTCGLGYFVQQRHLSETTDPLAIHCPADAIPVFRAMLDLGHLFAERIKFPIRFSPIKSGHRYAVGRARISAHPTSHCARIREFAADHGYSNAGECFGFRIEVGGRTLVYTADLGSTDDLDIFPRPIDTLIVDAAHVALDRLWPWAAGQNLSRIVLTHYKDDFDISRLHESKKYTAAEVTLATDGMRLPLT